jgi:putative YphP/YqiW family bacilliredoxin
MVVSAGISFSVICLYRDTTYGNFSCIFVLEHALHYTMVLSVVRFFSFFFCGEYMPYDPLLVQPMREELTRLGVQELRTADEVDATLGLPGTTFVVVNSVCGCAAGGARPAVAMAMEHSVRPDRIVTVFAGQDVEATQRARQYFTQQPPSSPAMAMLKDGELVAMIHRHHIEGRMPETLAQAIKYVFDEYCTTVEQTVEESV